MATKQEVIELLEQRDVEYVKHTTSILDKIDHIVIAVCVFLDCKYNDFEWLDVEYTESSIILHGIVKQGTDNEQSLLSKINNDTLSVNVPDQFIENPDPMSFVKYLIDQSMMYAKQMTELQEASNNKKNVTVH